MYDSLDEGARNVDPRKASYSLRSVSPVDLQETIRTRLSDSNISCRLAFEIEKLRGQNVTALSMYGGRAVLL